MYSRDGVKVSCKYCFVNYCTEKNLNNPLSYLFLICYNSPMAEKKDTATPALTKEADGTISVKITIPKEDIKKTWEQEMAHVVKTANIQGFRKGKAPAKMVENNVNKEKLREEVLR